jgi:hypothetical protein
VLTVASCVVGLCSGCLTKAACHIVTATWTSVHHVACLVQALLRHPSLLLQVLVVLVVGVAEVEPRPREHHQRHRSQHGVASAAAPTTAMPSRCTTWRRPRRDGRRAALRVNAGGNREAFEWT